VDSTAVGDAAMRAEQLTNLANVQFYFGRYVEAAHYYQEALDIANAAGDQPWAARRRRLTLASKASLQLRLGQYQQALATFDELDTASAELRPRERAEVLVTAGCCTGGSAIRSRPWPLTRRRGPCSRATGWPTASWRR
jgi:tetratricopeptide (TPR) repeat protein